MNPPMVELTEAHMRMEDVRALPLYDWHFQQVQEVS